MKTRRTQIFNNCFLSLSILLLTACATPTIGTSTKNNNNNNNPASSVNQQAAIEDINTDSIKVSSATAKAVVTHPIQKEPPLFTFVQPVIDPVMWTNESEANLTIMPAGEPLLVGWLPGQRKLPFSLYDEAAVHHPLHETGAIIYRNAQGPDNLWERIRNGFVLPHQKNKRLTANINWYARHPEYIDRVAKRAEKYLYLIVEEVEKANVPLEIALLPIVESAFQPFAYSHGRAAGIWQFIPSTGRLYDLKQNWWYDGRRDIAASTRAAIKFLTDMKEAFNDDWMLALAAYNSGMGTVSRAIRKNKRLGKPTTFWDLDLPRETEGYVPKLLAIAEIINDPNKYGISLMPIKNTAYLAEVEIGSQIDLALAAELAEIEMEQLYILNPAYNRWATDPKGPHKLLVPVEKKTIFENNLAALPVDQRITWQRHRIQKGQSLLAISDKYNTTVALIKEVNNLHGNLIREGQSLIIPVSSRNGKVYALSQEQRLLALQNTKRKGKEKETYRVKSGDSLWSISRKFNVNHRSLAKWNGLAPKDTLKLGKELVIWTKGVAQQRAAFSPHASKLVTQKVNYKVRRGDSLSGISRKFNVAINDLKKWNSKLQRQKYLQPGQRLTLYVDVTTQGG